MLRDDARGNPVVGREARAREAVQGVGFNRRGVPREYVEKRLAELKREGRLRRRPHGHDCAQELPS